MKRRRLGIHACMWLLICSPTMISAGEVILVGARVLDETGERFLPDRSVRIRDGRIIEIVPSQYEKTPGDAERLDLSGLHLIPGLIDLHTHLLLRPYDQMSWDDQVLRESLELRTVRAVTSARATLEAGFTTIRDLGTEGAGFADAAVRDAVAAGMIPGPRIFAATRAIVPTACYGPSGFDPRWAIPKGAQEADGVSGVRRAVREQIAAGADWIKVYADYRRVPGGPSTPTFSQEELNALVDEARSAERPVAAHAVTDEAIRRVVTAGVATVEHGSQASIEAFQLMRDHGMVLCPTLAAHEAMARYEGWKPGEPEPKRIRSSKAAFGRALESGVTIACGSDVGVFAHGDNAREIELMVEYGMPPARALAAATSIAAEVLRRKDQLGRIAPGCVADLVAVRGDPLEDVSALRAALVVIKNGSIILDRRKVPDPE